MKTIQTAGAQLTTRRRLLQSGAAIGSLAAGSALLPPRAYAAKEEITIYTWETYQDDPWLEEYRKKTGVKVNAIVTGSSDEMYAKTRSGAVDPDIIYFDIGTIPRYLKAGLIAPIDVSKVTNAKNITPGIDWQRRCIVDGKVYAVPYNWGTQPLMYNTTVVQPKPISWATLWDSQYAGKVNLPDDAGITFPMVALYVGAKDPYHLTDAEFKRCIEAFKALRAQLRTMSRGFADQTTVFASGDADVGYCLNVSSVFQLQGQGTKVDYVFPKEGTPTWIDCAIVTPKGARRQVVYDFINEGLTPAWQARFITSSVNNGILTAAAAAAAGVPKKILAETNIPDEEAPSFWDKMSILQYPNEIDRRLDIWNAFKAGTL
jgi:spermidine/putrescine transport system substrate-binding protein